MKTKMMKPTELRIGNHVGLTFDDGEDVFIVSSITQERVYVKSIDAEFQVDFPLTNVLPIPLTEEWLEKFGLIGRGDKPEFNEDTKSTWYYWVKGAFNLEVCEGDKWGFEVYSHYIEVKHVHHLQNLYFDITGEELKLID